MDLRTALTARGLSIRQAARQMNYDPAYLSRVVNGRQQPSPALLTALENLLGTPWEPLPDPRRHRADPQVVTALAGTLAAQRRAEDALGPIAVLPATLLQMQDVTARARNSTGPHQRELLSLAAEYHQFAGWLHAATHQWTRALELLTTAEEMADEADDGLVAATAVSFRGYIARQRGNARGVVRASFAALHTPGIPPARRTFDLIQAATGYAALGKGDEARRMLDTAWEDLDRVSDLPPALYYYGPDFFRMNVGMVLHALGDHDDARDLLRAGLAALPVEQQGAEWTQEYRDLLAL